MQAFQKLNNAPQQNNAEPDGVSFAKKEGQKAKSGAVYKGVKPVNVSLGSGNHNRQSQNIVSTGQPITLQRKCSCGGECPDCKKDKEEKEVGNISLQKKGNGAPVTGQSNIPPVVHDVIQSSGSQLDATSRAYMESRLKHNFGNVKIHSDNRASLSAKAVHARAYTVGNNIVFANGKADISSIEGRRLMAHELTHVVQQSKGGAPPGIDQNPDLERDANDAANKVANGDTAAGIKGSSGTGIARDPAPGEVYYEVKFPDGVKRLTAAEFEAQKAVAIRRLRIDLKLVADLAENGRSSQVDMLKDYHGGVESFTDILKKPKALIGIAADMKAGVTPPYIGMWAHAKNASAQGIEALNRGDLATGARMLRLADSQYRSSMQEWNQYREATIGGAEGVASNLETIRDVSFAIALVAGAVVAAPVIAAGVGTLGATGALATGLTAVGTATTTGALGVGLGGGSAAIASYANTGKVDKKAVAHDAAKFGKQGFVTGLTVGLGTAVGATGKAAQLAQPLVQQSLRRCLTEAGINVTGELTSAALDKLIPEEKDNKAGAEQAPKPKVPPVVTAAITGCVSGALGVPIGKIGNAAVKKGTEVAVGAGVGYASARLSGQDNTQALIAAAQATGTHLAVSGAQQKGRPPAPGKKPVTAEPQAALPKAGAAIEDALPGKATAVKPKPTEEAPKPAAHAEEKIPGQKKVTALEDVAPAIMKEDAVAKQPLENGHEVVVTKQGVGICSPSPCPVIHLEYAKELADNPKLKGYNDKLQALRKTNPKEAAKAAKLLITLLEEQRAGAIAVVKPTSKKGGRFANDPDLAKGIADEQKVSSVDVPESDKSLSDLDNVKSRRAKKQEKVTHSADLGVAEGKIKAEEHGLTHLFDNPRGMEHHVPGLDSIYKDKAGNIVIVEFKGGGAKLSEGQMKRAWIKRKIEFLEKHPDLKDLSLTKDLRKAFDSGKIAGRTYSTPLDPITGQVLDTVVEDHGFY
jgi:hypothetical protein